MSAKNRQKHDISSDLISDNHQFLHSNMNNNEDKDLYIPDPPPACILFVTTVLNCILTNKIISEIF